MTRVVLVDDHALVREGLRAMLDSIDVEVVGEASDGRRALRLAEELAPDVVLMDVALPELNGIEATRRIARRCPEVRVIIVTMHVDGRYVFEAMAAGASGYVVKDAAFEQLREAIETVVQGGRYLSAEAEAAQARQEAASPPVEGRELVAMLTPRERQILRLIAEGLTSAEIATQLRIRPRTVDTHRSNICRKTGQRTAAGLTKLAIRSGLSPVITG